MNQDGEKATWLHDIAHSSFIFSIIFVHFPFPVYWHCFALVLQNSEVIEVALHEKVLKQSMDLRLGHED